MASTLHGMKIESEKILELHSAIDGWITMQSPIPVLIIVLFYLVFVLKTGPSYMRNRQPYEIKWILIVYNFIQVIFSVYLCNLCYSVVGIAVKNLFAPGCKVGGIDVNQHQRNLALASWWYMCAKLTELLDTIFFVLRKKFSQVTFLHVYHHAIMMTGTWVYLKFTPGEHGAVIGFMNSLVHIVMYTYYAIAALGPEYTKYLWWKKYMTAMQLIQFILMLSYLLCLSLSPSCQFHRAYTYFMVVNVGLFFYLFLNFYRKSYSKQRKVKLDHSTTKMDEQLIKDDDLRISHPNADSAYKENYRIKNGRSSMVESITPNGSLSKVNCVNCVINKKTDSNCCLQDNTGIFGNGTAIKNENENIINELSNLEKNKSI